MAQTRAHFSYELRGSAFGPAKIPQKKREFPRQSVRRIETVWRVGHKVSQVNGEPA